MHGMSSGRWAAVTLSIKKCKTCPSESPMPWGKGPNGSDEFGECQTHPSDAALSVRI